MRKVILYIGVSVDGYIADCEGNVDWLVGEEEHITDNSYDEFVQSIDTVIMGRITYEQVVNELSPDYWPYEQLNTYIISNTVQVQNGKITTDDDVCNLVRKLKNENGKDIWICGGTQIAMLLIREGLIDTYHLSTIPVLLGNGIRLFDQFETRINLHLTSCYDVNGIVTAVYDVRDQE